MSEISLERSLQALERLAPPELAEPWDNSGLQVGDPKATVKRALVALDPSPEVLEKALEIKADLIVTHHPLLLKPLSSIDLGKPTGKIVATLIKESIALYCAHSNFDRADGGLNDILAKKIGLSGLTPLCKGEALSKVVVTVPTEHAPALVEAMGHAGAGRIGNYSDCAFTTIGKGQFTPGEDAEPFIGERSKPAEVEEARIEMVAPASALSRVKRAAFEAHPYEEPAYDVYPMNCHSGSGALGRVGALKTPVSLEELARSVKNSLGVEGVRYVGKATRAVERVAVCGGSGASLWPLALASGAQALLTGDVKHHDALDAAAAGLCLIDAGHCGTESAALEGLASLLEEGGVEATVFRQKSPFEWVT